MGNNQIEELLKIVVEYLQSEEGNLSGAVDIAVKFSTKNSISSDLLLAQSSLCGSKGFHELAYVLAKTAANSSTGSTKASAHCTSGLASYFMGRPEEAEEQYKLALETDPKHVNTHINYGNLLSEMGRPEEAEEQYKLALETDPKHVATHYNYGNLLLEMGRPEEAEEQYKLALKTDPKHVATHYNYGIFLKQMGRLEEAEEQYKLALETDPNDVATHYNYGNLLKQMGRPEEAEEQYKLALETDPKHVATHYNYGNLLKQMGRREEAEEQYKVAIELDPKKPNSHGAYGLLLLSKNLESKAKEEMKIASRLFGENGDRVKEHLSLAWLYEEFANKYYNLENYIKSGEYAEISGSEYIKAGKQAGDKFKSTSLTKGYTLKGRAKIRKLEIKNPFYKDVFKRIWNRESYEVEKFTKIIDCIMDASRCYEKAAESSPKDNQLCNACSISMSCLSEMLDYMLAVIKQKKTPKLEDKLKNWNEKMAVAKSVYKKHSKGEIFIESLYKLMGCIQNLDKYKKHGTREYGRAFEECRKELSEIANNIEGPLQKIIEESAKQMDLCRFKIIPYAGTETGYIRKSSKLSQFSKWILDPKKRIITGIAGIAGIILTVIISHYNEYLFSLMQKFVSILFSYL
ncbi:cellulose synthase subunit BcsC [Methanosarcina lacustris Z-7289]|uniref:Cellulose synthase subunit BcsC n=1 Tax=Methanosarcina lacustris Z-7289 TaxID=1434111 RepID=A0A0E3S6I1_9EURY|nr:tetratricopeptide repeat protein [Methanosarcina lacustris]AKB74887.1 cellulose synthase subunit BcsC [Methanosarcina lacustris Z-7289]